MIVRVQGVEEVMSQVALPACSYPWKWRVSMRWNGRRREAEVKGDTNVCCALCPSCVDKINPYVLDETEDLMRRHWGVDYPWLVCSERIQGGA